MALSQLWDTWCYRKREHPCVWSICVAFCFFMISSCYRSRNKTATSSWWSCHWSSRWKRCVRCESMSMNDVESVYIIHRVHTYLYRITTDLWHSQCLCYSIHMITYPLIHTELAEEVGCSLYRYNSYISLRDVVVLAKEEIKFWIPRPKEQKTHILNRYQLHNMISGKWRYHYIIDTGKITFTSVLI